VLFIGTRFSNLYTIKLSAWGGREREREREKFIDNQIDDWEGDSVVKDMCYERRRAEACVD
jgi:hypothetical protein